MYVLLSVLLYVLAAFFAIVGVVELLPAIFQWIPYLFANALSVVFGGHGYETIDEIAASFPGEPAFFFRFHGMPAAYASPFFLAASVLLALIGGASQAVNEKSVKRRQSEVARKNEQEAAKRREEATRIRTAAVSAEREERRIRELQCLVAETARLSQSIPAHLRYATAALDLAEREFNEGLLDPFWDAIETATKELATVDATSRYVAANLDRCRQEAKKADLNRDSAAPIAIGLSHLPRIPPLYARLLASVRNAQRRADYSTIFHLRRTNVILVQGFTTFGQALYDIGARLESSLNDVNVAIAHIHSTNSDFAAEVTEQLRLLRTHTEHMESQTLKIEEKKLDILDNIQRGRRPTGAEWKPGTQKK